MRAIEAHLATLPPASRPSRDAQGYEWYADRLRELGWVSYGDLAYVVYGADQPTRAQLSAIARAVTRLEEQGKIRRELTGHPTERLWSRTVPGTGRRSGGEGTRRGFGVQRETLVTRDPAREQTP